MTKLLGQKYITSIKLKLETALHFLEKSCGKNGITEVIVIKDGQVVFEGDSVHKVHGIWSSTKSFTSTVLGLLIAEGKCSLDSKVMKNGIRSSKCSGKPQKLQIEFRNK